MNLSVYSSRLDNGICGRCDVKTGLLHSDATDRSSQQFVPGPSVLTWRMAGHVIHIFRAE